MAHKPNTYPQPRIVTFQIFGNPHFHVDPTEVKKQGQLNLLNVANTLSKYPQRLNVNALQQ